VPCLHFSQAGSIPSASEKRILAMKRDLTSLLCGLCGVLFVAIPTAAETEVSDLVELGRELRGADRYAELDLAVGGLRVALAGYLQHWEIQIGHGWTIVLVSQMRGAYSKLLVFSERGSLIAMTDVGAEIGGIALCDLNQDGISEVIVDQLDGWGTGVLETTYSVYGIAGATRELWSGLSLAIHEMPGEGINIKRGYLRCEPSGWDVPYTRLVHLEVSRRSGKEILELHYLKLEDERLVEVESVREPD
jgi:hypothetical protein